MTPSEQQYFESLFHTFSTDGWKAFIEDMQSNFDALNHVQNISDAKELHFKQGQLNALSAIINFETAIRNSHDDAEALMQGGNDA